MRNLLFLIIFLFSNQISAKENLVDITVFGTGKNFEIAKNNALRSALEQVTGTYISAKTTVLNDVIESDNIVSITNGSIVKYEILEKTEINNEYQVLIYATISANRLVNYISQKTSTSVTINGSLFVTNATEMELNQKAEEIALNNIFIVFREIYKKSFDINLTSDQPISCSSDHYRGKSYKWGAKFAEIKIHLSCKANSNIKKALSFLMENLKDLSISKEAAVEYKRLTGNECWEFCGMLFRTDPNRKRNYKIDENNVFGVKEQNKIAFAFLESFTLVDGITEYLLHENHLSSVDGREVRYNNYPKILRTNYPFIKKGDKFIYDFNFVYSDEELKYLTSISIK
jgi:hypothetical protein